MIGSDCFLSLKIYRSCLSWYWDELNIMLNLNSQLSIYSEELELGDIFCVTPTPHFTKCDNEININSYVTVS